MNAFGLSTAEAAAIQALVATMNAAGIRDQVHADRLTALARAVAAELGVDETVMREVTILALVHDVGKLGSQLSRLSSQGPLTPEERSLLSRHPIVGSQILADLPPLARLAPKHAAQHERWDGRGYPAGLAGPMIPLCSRIVYACDAFLAMCEDRPYRGALPRSTAAAVITIAAGTQFCPTVAGALAKVIAAPARGTQAAEPAPRTMTPQLGPTAAPPRPAPLPRAVARARDRQAAAPRIAFDWPAWVYVLAVAAGLVLGCRLAFPLPHLADLCSPHTPGVGECELTKIWVPAAERIGLCAIAAGLLLWLVGRIPGWIMHGRRSPGDTPRRATA